MIGVSTQRTFRQLHRLQGQCSEALLHHRIALQQADQFRTRTLDIGQRIEQVKHPATFRQQGFARRVVRADRRQHRGILRQRHMVQLRIAARQVQAVRLGQTRVTDRREK
ncbi:hypothetical protein D9M71_743430 [compost metagenome]